MKAEYSRMPIRCYAGNQFSFRPAAFTLAVSAVVNNACVDIKGDTVLDAKGDITASAYGRTKYFHFGFRPQAANTGSTGSTGSTTQAAGKSGGFFAISVAIQDVFAAIRKMPVLIRKAV